MNQFDKDRYQKIDEDADTFLENLKRSKWTPFILLAVVLAVFFAYFLG